MDRTTATGATICVAEEVAQERIRQDAKWGEQNHPSIHHKLVGSAPATSVVYGVPAASIARARCDAMDSVGAVTWAHILVEEVAEAVEAASISTAAELRTELIQVAAVCVAWVECLDRRD